MHGSVAVSAFTLPWDRPHPRHQELLVSVSAQVAVGWGTGSEGEVTLWRAGARSFLLIAVTGETAVLKAGAGRATRTSSGLVAGSRAGGALTSSWVVR